MYALACLAAVVGVAAWWLSGRGYKCLLPGPPTLPLLGNLLFLSSDPATLFARILRLHTTYGRRVRLYLGSRLIVFLSDPVDVQAVFGDPKVINRDFYLLLPFFKVMGEGLLTNRGDEWLTNRKLLNPAFGRGTLERYVAMFGMRAQQLGEKFEGVADGRTIDPLEMLGQMAVEAVRDTMFGIDVDWPEENFMELFAQGGKLMTKCAVRPWLMFESVFRRTEDGKAFYNLRQEINDRSSSVIRQKLSEHRAETGASPGEDRSRSFVDALIAAVGGSDDEADDEATVTRLQQQLNHLVVAAVDTSTTALANFLSLMGIHPEMQQQVSDELSAIFGDDPRLPTSADLHRMKVIDRCLKETLRLFTAAPWNTREIDKAVTLRGGVVLPGGATVVVNGFAVHRDPENYAEPLRFNPDRWLEENDCGRHPYAFVAFGGGRRNCIGYKYAWLQMKTVVSCVFRRFRVTTQATIESMDHFGALPILRPLEGYRIQLHALSK